MKQWLETAKMISLALWCILDDSTVAKAQKLKNMMITQSTPLHFQHLHIHAMQSVNLDPSKYVQVEVQCSQILCSYSAKEEMEVFGGIWGSDDIFCKLNGQYCLSASCLVLHEPYKGRLTRGGWQEEAKD